MVSEQHISSISPCLSPVDEAKEGMIDHRRTAPATQRNRDPILGVLRRILPPTGLVLEIASGTGEHVAHFAAALPSLRWQPSDPDPIARPSIEAWTAGTENILAPLLLDASAETWPVERVEAIICINMVHISPWAASEGLMVGAARVLTPGGRLFLYGPYLEADVETAPSNLAFDASLRSRDPAWGLRDLAEVSALAAASGLVLAECIAMPANNLTVVFERR